MTSETVTGARGFPVNPEPVPEPTADDSNVRFIYSNACIKRPALSPTLRVQVNLLLCRLLDEKDWQAHFSADELSVWLGAADYYLRVRAAAGAEMELEYQRVLRMFKSASQDESTGQP